MGTKMVSSLWSIFPAVDASSAIGSRIDYYTTTKCVIFYADKNSINLLVNISRGDLRKAINLIQKCKNFKYINNKIIYSTLGIINYENIKTTIDYALDKNEKIIIKLIKYYINESYSLIYQISIIINIILKHKNISDFNKAKIILNILEIDQNLLNGSNEFIQYKKLFYYIMSL